LTRKRKWQEGEFNSGAAVIKPIRAPRQNVRVASDEMIAALSKAIRLVEQDNTKPEALAQALAELRGTINFCRARWGLNSVEMGTLASATQMRLETKYPTPSYKAGAAKALAENRLEHARRALRRRADEEARRRMGRYET
jgi:hypothetical protein